MKKEKRIYAKCFNVYNNNGTFTEEDFNLLREKFDIIRKLYTDDNIQKDTFGSFRGIMKEVKRAAHNAELTADLFKNEYYSDYNSIMMCNTNNENTKINLIVTFKKLNPEIKRNAFTVTKFLGFDSTVELSTNQTLSIIIDDDMRDDTYITYDFGGEEI